MYFNKVLNNYLYTFFYAKGNFINVPRNYKDILINRIFWYNFTEKIRNLKITDNQITFQKMI